MFLRLIKDEDLDLVAQLNAEREVRKFFPDGTQDREQTKQRIKQIINLIKIKDYLDLLYSIS
ncbi:hypothetical protein [Legionella bozemanae]